MVMAINEKYVEKWKKKKISINIEEINNERERKYEEMKKMKEGVM